MSDSVPVAPRLLRPPFPLAQPQRLAGRGVHRRGVRDRAGAAVPRAAPAENFTELRAAMKSLVPFAVTFTIIAYVWVGCVPASPTSLATSGMFGRVLTMFSRAKPLDGVSDFGRVLVNSTIGMLGVFDVATDLGLEKHDEDLGQTLAVWGVGDGPYLVLPFLGPSTVRDSVALIGDMQADPVGHVEEAHRLRICEKTFCGNASPTLCTARLACAVSERVGDAVAIA